MKMEVDGVDMRHFRNFCITLIVKEIRKPIYPLLIQLSGLYVGILDGGKQSLTAR